MLHFTLVESYVYYEYMKFYLLYSQLYIKDAWEVYYDVLYSYRFYIYQKFIFIIYSVLS